MNADNGKLQRTFSIRCAVCKREETVPLRRKESAAEHFRDMGWAQTRRLTDTDERFWICSKHRRAGSYKVFRDAEIDGSELGPGDVAGLG
jgi:hypothetical protein